MTGQAHIAKSWFGMILLKKIESEVADRTEEEIAWMKVKLDMHAHTLTMVVRNRTNPRQADVEDEWGLFTFHSSS